MDTSTSSASARRPGGYAYTSGSESDKVLYYINHAQAAPPTVAHRTIFNIFLDDPPPSRKCRSRATFDCNVYSPWAI